MFLRVRLLSSRKHLRNPELNESRSILELSGYWPASGRVQANYSSFKRTHLCVPELDQRPLSTERTVQASPRAGAPWTIRTERSRRHLVLPWPPDSPATPPVVAKSGYWPGSDRVQANHSSFQRTHLKAPYPAQYTATPGPAGEPFAAFDNSSWISQTRRWPETAAYLQRSTLGVFKDTPTSFYTGEYPSAFAAVRAHRIWFERKHLTVPMPDEFIQTPTTEAIIPAFFAPKQHQRHDRPKHLRKVTRLESFPRTIQSPAAYAPVDTIRRRDTARIIQFPLQLDERPATPAVSEQPPTAFLAPIQHRRKGWSNIVVLAEYPDRKVNVFPTARGAITTMWYWDRFRYRKGA